MIIKRQEHASREAAA